ncbi:TPR and ankyrin repeat-containing protein 1 [Rhinophrynus dorsalis]
MLADFRKEAAILFYNRANALFRLEKWAEALMSTLQTIQLDKTYIKNLVFLGLHFNTVQGMVFLTEDVIQQVTDKPMLSGFAFSSKHYQFVALPFGLASAPLVFTRVMGDLAAFIHTMGISMTPYLDDLLIMAPSEEWPSQAKNVLDYKSVAYYRAGYCYLKLYDVMNASAMFFNGLSLSDRCDRDDIAEFVTGIFMTFEVDIHCINFSMMFDRVLREKYDKETWKLVIEKLVQKGMFKVLPVQDSPGPGKVVTFQRGGSDSLGKGVLIPVPSQERGSDRDLSLQKFDLPVVLSFLQEVRQDLLWWLDRSNLVKGKPFVVQFWMLVTMDAGFYGRGSVLGHLGVQDVYSLFITGERDDAGVIGKGGLSGNPSKGSNEYRQSTYASSLHYPVKGYAVPDSQYMRTITMGANVESIGDFPLHAILRLCIKAEDSNLFKFVMKNKSAMKEKINHKDGDGSTLLHIVASTSTTSHGYTVKSQSQYIKMLLDYGEDPSIPNKEGKCASDILKKNKNFKAEDIIKKHLASHVLPISQTKEPSEKYANTSSDVETTSLVSALEQFTDFCSRELVQMTDFLKHKKVKCFLHLLSSVKVDFQDWRTPTSFRFVAPKSSGIPDLSDSAEESLEESEDDASVLKDLTERKLEAILKAIFAAVGPHLPGSLLRHLSEHGVPEGIVCSADHVQGVSCPGVVLGSSAEILLSGRQDDIYVETVPFTMANTRDLQSCLDSCGIRRVRGQLAASLLESVKSNSRNVDVDPAGPIDFDTPPMNYEWQARKLMRAPDNIRPVDLTQTGRLWAGETQNDGPRFPDLLGFCYTGGSCGIYLLFPGSTKPVNHGSSGTHRSSSARLGFHGFRGTRRINQVRPLALLLTIPPATPAAVSGTQVLTSSPKIVSLAPVSTALESGKCVLSRGTDAPAMGSGSTVLLSHYVTPDVVGGTQILTRDPFVAPENDGLSRLIGYNAAAPGNPELVSGNPLLTSPCHIPAAVSGTQVLTSSPCVVDPEDVDPGLVSGNPLFTRASDGPTLGSGTTILLSASVFPESVEPNLLSQWKPLGPMELHWPWIQSRWLQTQGNLTPAMPGSLTGRGSPMYGYYFLQDRDKGLTVCFLAQDKGLPVIATAAAEPTVTLPAVQLQPLSGRSSLRMAMCRGGCRAFSCARHLTMEQSNRSYSMKLNLKGHVARPKANDSGASLTPLLIVPNAKRGSLENSQNLFAPHALWPQLHLMGPPALSIPALTESCEEDSFDGDMEEGECEEGDSTYTFGDPFEADPTPSVEVLIIAFLTTLPVTSTTDEEIPPDITCDIPESISQGLITQLLLQQKWPVVLLLLTGNTNGESTRDNRGLLPKIGPLFNIDIGPIIINMSPRVACRLPLIRLLLEHGASPDGIGAVCEQPIKTCLKRNDFELAYLLLSKGGNPQAVSIKQGDTPLHAAAIIALNKKDDNGVHIMKHLLNLYSSKSSEYPYLDPNIQDNNGDTVMHIIFQSDNVKQCKRIMDLLSKFDIKLGIKNKSGKDARHRIKNSDLRFIAWNEAKKKNRRDQSCAPAKLIKTSSAGDVPQTELQTELSSTPQMPVETKCGKAISELELIVSAQPSSELTVDLVESTKKPMTVRETLVQIVRDFIRGMELTKTPTESSIPMQTVISINQYNEIPMMCPNIPCQNEDPHEGLFAINGVVVCGADEFPAQGNNEDVGNRLEQDIDLSDIDFNNMTWEIECAPEALKKLGSKAIPQYMKNKIILSIQKLGNGEWTRSLHKPLKYLKSDIKLFEVILDKGARMLWELAIDFSPRCSEEPEKLMATKLSSHASEKTGRVYTEIIRVWDIVLDHCKLSKAIEGICSAYNRGMNCILRKKLKGITKAQLSSNVEKRIPLCFVEDIELEFNMNIVIPDYFPPASAAETEYNIMKFHSFSTDMALNILSNINARVEYPFRVGELEYAVIDLNPKPMETIILIGRSGTGKTTCCLYRLWKKFHSYWEKSESIGGPWLVKQTWQRRTFNEINERDDPEDEEATETDSSESIDEEQMPLEHELLPEEDETTEPDACVEDPVNLEHYHPIFITKNYVLCQEVQRNFLELSKSTKATSHFKPVEPNVYKLQDLQDENFPMFVTSQQLLLLLDASMPDPFFPRNEDGSLKRNIIGWSTAEELDIPDLLREDDEVDAEPEKEEEETVCELKENDPRVFVTFEVFANELWPKMVKGKSIYNAALVWKEIKSFLKGSFEALNCHQGKLSEEEYYKLGKKRAPTFQEDRKEIYRLFSVYEQIKSKRGYFDEEDVLYNLSCRLSNLEELPWSIHELYGDEIQDFTQAELCLLMRCINDPNSMFLTGDTAQSIMKGVSFRFSDLRSLFYYANKNCTSERKNCVVRKPKRIYQLYQNYRSHSGILHLASGVVDLLQFYFPESFDRLPRDCGLFDGPKPTVLESCSVSDLAILLRGNKRKTQPIEFGAHQVILVTNEIAKEKIPEELSLALVLTIYEAKGLEFDDVLLYNFFTDSEAPKEWRIISSFKPVSYLNEERQPLIEVPLDITSTPASRQLTMNPELHKMLNGELKQLYTAVTRARVNLWIFDENQEKRAPAFEYFIKGNFVQVVRTDEDKDLDDNMFVKTSTKQEWISQGDYYANHKCWKVAAKCYQKGGATDKEKLAFAHDAVLSLQSKKLNNRERQMEYLRLAKTYLECREPKLALKCLTLAKEFHLCAELCKKMEKIKDAAYFFKKIQDNKAAAEYFEQAGEFELALNLYYKEKMFEEAANVLERYKRKHPEAQLTFTAKQCYLEAAADYFSSNKLKKMNEVISKLDIEDQLFFLQKRKLWSDAANLLKSNGRCEEAALLMRNHGELLQAADLTMKKDFRASCLLAAARCCVKNTSENSVSDEVLNEAVQLFKETQNKVGVAEATLLQGIKERDFGKLSCSFEDFKSVLHRAGVVEALFESVTCEESDQSLLDMASWGLNSLIILLKALKETKTNSERETVKSCFDFFGVVQMEGQQCSVLQYEGARILQLCTEENFEFKDKKTKAKLYCLELADVKSLLEKHLLRRLCNISAKILTKAYPDICSKFFVGLSCTDENCKDFHRPLLQHELKSILQSKINLTTISGLLVEAQNLSEEVSHELQEILSLDTFRYCRSLLNVFFPKHFHLRILSENTGVCRMFESIRQRFPEPCKSMLNKYVAFLFQQSCVKLRRESTDLWLNAMHIFTLSFHYPDGLHSLLEKEEWQYDREYSHLIKKVNEAQGDGKKIKGLEGRFGMLKPDVSSFSGKDTHIHFFRLLQSSVDELYVNRNPDYCKKLFYRFMNLLVLKCVEPLIPNIANTVMLLEFQFILCCAVIMRLNPETRVLLPKSYISILHHWEFMFRSKGTKPVMNNTYSILNDYKPKDVNRSAKNFRHHLFYLVKVLCGAENITFNVLLDAFNDIDYITSGETERTLVLCLVMMVNLHGVIEQNAEDILWKYFPQIQERLRKMKEEFPSRVPQRLSNVVDNIAVAANLEIVVDFLQELLSQRDEERLVECSWRWNTTYTRSPVCGIFYNDKFNYKMFTHVQKTVQIVKYTYADNEQEDFPEENVDLVTALASQVQQKKSAMRQFHELLLLVCFTIKWKRALLRKKKGEMEELIPDIFKKAGVDRTQCDICGVKFSLLPPSSSTSPNEFEEDFLESGTPASNGVDGTNNFETREIPCMNDTYESHINLELHRQQMKAYNAYFQFYILKVNVLLCEGKCLMQSMEHMTRDQMSSREELSLELTKIENKIKGIVDLIKDIYENKTWTEAEVLMKYPMQDLTTSISEARKVMSETEQHIAKREGLQKEDVYENEMYYAGFEELCNKKKKRGKKKTKRH